MEKVLIIFTDLDGTLLDAQYSFDDAASSLDVIRKRGVPLILCSSKTRLEIEFYRKKLKNTDPFISENGGGIFIPKGCFTFRIPESGYRIDENEDYFIITLGAEYSALRGAISELRKQGFDVKGFGDMSIREVSELTGLGVPEAEMAKAREFDEPFVFKGDDESRERLIHGIEKRGFSSTQGELLHILGNSDKGRAVSFLQGLYRRQYHQIVSIALGDSPNDIEMLRQVQYPVIIQKRDGSYDERIDVKGLIRADGIGPIGWDKAVLELLETLLF